MRKIYTALCAMAVATMAMAQQQQVPNGGFEEEWGNCVPWTFYGSEDKYGELSEVVTGTTPASWTISNVAGMASYYEAPMGLGATVVGEKLEGGYGESAAAVKLTNTPNPFMAAQIVPAYITLGTSWSTANPGFGAEDITISNSDGGAFGGMEFTDRPKGIEFMYKRSRGESKPDEQTTIVAYLWKGHWTQKDVPVTIYMGGEPICKDMVDRDRCVLGMDMTGCQGGEVTASDDAKLIAKIVATITENTEEWTKFSANFEYLSDETPEMMNIIIASGDYFGGASVVGKDNSLTIDDVKFVYDEVAEEPEGDKYNGTLSIDLSQFLGMPDPEVIDNQNLNIISTEENKCTIAIYNLVFGGGSLGDIVVPNVAVTEANGTKSYDGEGDVKLLGGIEAKAHVFGTEDANGNISLKIDVSCNSDTPNIFVTYNGKKASTAGISAIEADENAPAEYYDMRGIRHNADSLAPGLYIKRQGAKATKVLVK